MQLSPSLRQRLARFARVLLCALLVAGLFPDGDAVVRSLADLAVAQHDDAASQDPGADCDSGCPDRGCTPGSHHCQCCAPASVVPPRRDVPELFAQRHSRARYRAASDRAPPDAGRDRAFRPPIA